MKDTKDKIVRIFNDMLMKKAPEERIKMCFSMLNTAKKIVLSTIKDKNNWRQEMFLRFYSDDFTKDQKKKIITSLNNFSFTLKK